MLIRTLRIAKIQISHKSILKLKIYKKLLM